MKKNITYIFGAGASFHSIPIVNSLNERIQLFLNMYKNYKETNLQYADVKLPRKSKLPKYYTEFFEQRNILEKYRNVVEEAIKHRTVDTYAKKLWLIGEDGKLNLLKEFLCLYFAFEQSELSDKLLIGNKIDSEIVEAYESIELQTSTFLDYRYDVFMATLLSKDLKLPSNISIISWNYDYQIELAYMQYRKCRIEKARKSLNIFPRDIRAEDITESKREIGSIIKLNGSANQLYFDTNRAKDTVCSMDSFQSDQDYFLEVLHYISKPRDLKDNGEIALDFSWEKSSYIEESLRKSRIILSNTEILIVVGYSFPNFNRAVDSDLFSYISHSLIKEVKVQCSKDDYDMVKQNLSNVAENISDRYIQFHDDLSQFYIPTSQLH